MEGARIFKLPHASLPTEHMFWDIAFVKNF